MIHSDKIHTFGAVYFKPNYNGLTMMKTPNYFFLIIFLIGFVFSVQARKVEQNEAEKVAINYYYEAHNKFRGNVDYKDIAISNIFTRHEDGQPAFYAFDFKDGGFVIVAAEDAMYPIIGYAYTGKFPVNLNEHRNYASFLQTYVEQAAFARENNVEADEFAKNTWNHLLLSAVDDLNTDRGGSRDVEPLVSSLWNQDDPYNYYAPEDAAGPGGHCYAGCVATCMSQVMHYWRYPETGEGSHSYYASGYGTQSANFGTTDYNWTAMKNNIDNSSPFAIAELQYHAGVSVDMGFGPNGSGAQSGDVDDAMRNYFRYDNALYMEKSSYPTSTWTTILQDEIDLGRPLYYSGYTSDWSGHAFVCDGYQGSNFHFNFGWSGSGNGYYSLYNVNGFYVDQRAVKNLYPTDSNYPYYASGQTVITDKSGSITDGSGPVENYLDNTSASWLIDPQTEEDSITDITLYFVDFDLDAGDYLRIYDGETTSAPMLGEYTGTTLPDQHTSTGNKLLITLETDGSGTAPGFKAEFYSDYPDYCAGLVTLTEPIATFDDGSGSFNYAPGATCMFKIEPEYATDITVTFNYFDTEEDVDLVKVFDGNTQLGTFSGDEVPGPFVCTNGYVFITWSSNGTISKPGWEISYEIGNVSVEEEEVYSHLEIFPNPATNALNVNFSLDRDQNVEMRLVNVTGEAVYTNVLSNVSGDINNSIDVSGFAKGIYILNLSSTEGSINKKVIIK